MVCRSSTDSLTNPFLGADPHLQGRKNNTTSGHNDTLCPCMWKRDPESKEWTFNQQPSWSPSRLYRPYVTRPDSRLVPPPCSSLDFWWPSPGVPLRTSGLCPVDGRTTSVRRVRQGRTPRPRPRPPKVVSPDLYSQTRPRSPLTRSLSPPVCPTPLKPDGSTTVNLYFYPHVSP